jgi:hypothetical protein
MKTISICLLLITSIAWAGTPSIQGTVKDVNGHPIKGAEVKIEAKTGKATVIVLKTDANGHYVANGLAIGNYNVTLTINGAVKANILNAMTRMDKPTELSFDLRKATTTSKRHMVYVPQEIGSHIGGGRWVDVDENGNVVNDNSNIQTMNSEAAKQIQLNGNGSRSPTSR